MVSPDKVRKGVIPHLPPGELYRAAFAAEGGFMIGLPYRFRVVVVTDRNVHLYSAAWFSICKPKRYLGTHPAGVPLTTTRRLILNEVLHVAGERIWVRRPHHKDLRNAIEASRALIETGSDLH